MYEVVTGKLVASIAAHGDFAIASDNRTLFTADAMQIHAWDLATAKEVAERPIPGARKDSSRPAVADLLPLTGRRVFTSLADGSGLVWDFAPKPPTGKTANEKELAEWWSDLASANAARAYRAVWKMSEIMPDAMVPFLAQRLRPEPPADPAKLRKLIVNLNNDRFRVREQASKELLAMGVQAHAALQKALHDGPTAEARQRIEQLLSQVGNVATRPGTLRRLRAMQILERISSKESRAILLELAKGHPLAPETREARAALTRISP